MISDVQRLLADYVNDGSETAFRELVERYVGLVYSTAVRLVGGDTHLAEDVAQIVFVDLARLARSLSGEVRLGGWLHRHTCFTAAKTLRAERRRQLRERRAMEMNAPTDHSAAHLAQLAPVLDEAINQLGAADRAAVVLRFYERLDFHLVAEALGTSEAAAQKRVSRALEKLNHLLKRRGVIISTVALGTALSSEAVVAAPAGLAASIPSAAFTTVATGTGQALNVVKFMASTKLKAGMISAVLVASMVMPLLVQRYAQARLAEQHDLLRRRTNELAQVTTENELLSQRLAKAKNSPPGSDGQLHEVLRLRNEVGLLKRSVREISAGNTVSAPSAEDQLASMRKLYSAQVGRLRQWLETNSSEKIPELRNLDERTWIDAVSTLASDDDFERAARILRANAQNQVFDTLSSALRKFTRENSGQFPTDLAQLKPYFRTPIDDSILLGYEILPANKLVSELQPGGDWAITQRAPANPKWDLRMALGVTQIRVADERVTNRWAFVQ
jgi:RNA polymerase sigma factor (sigma-70 family)